jgi:hypothetical protein
MTLLPTMSAEANFRAAFKRLKDGAPKVLPPGTPVSQNNIAKEAGCDPSALRKARFPSLVAEIQNYLATDAGERPESERQKLLKQRQHSRSARDTIADLKKQRDVAAGLLVEANIQIAILTRRLIDAEARNDALQPKARTAPLTNSKSAAESTQPRKLGIERDKPPHRGSLLPRLVLIRGLPGRGKTTMALRYKRDGYAHFEADQFFDVEGQGPFDKEKLPEAHAWCLQQTREALEGGELVCVANVFGKVADIEPYTLLGVEYQVVEANYPGKSVHNVPDATMRAMEASWVPTEKLEKALKKGKSKPLATVTRIASANSRLP